MRYSLRSIAVSSILVFPSSTAFAQNLLPNSGFDDDLQGWTASAGTSWSEDDSNGSSLSGSLRIEVSEIASVSRFVCVPVSEGRVYDFGVDVKLEIPQNSAGRAGAVVRWTSDAGCTDELSDFPPNVFRTFAPDWDAAAGAATAPLGTVAARFELRATKTGGSGGSTIVGYLDDAFLVLASVCGDAAPPYDEVTTADALYVLRAAVGAVACDECVCDANDSGNLAASDALTVLRFSVGSETQLVCPACS